MKKPLQRFGQFHFVSDDILLSGIVTSGGMRCDFKIELFRHNDERDCFLPIVYRLENVLVDVPCETEHGGIENEKAQHLLWIVDDFAWAFGETLHAGSIQSARMSVIHSIRKKIGMEEK